MNHLIYVYIWDKDVDEQLRLRDDTIFHLKQEVSTMQLRIEDLNYENEDLRTQLSLATFKGEGSVLCTHNTPQFTDVCVCL